MWLYHRVMSPNDADGMANSVDPDHTAPLRPSLKNCLFAVLLPTHQNWPYPKILFAILRERCFFHSSGQNLTKGTTFLSSKAVFSTVDNVVLTMTRNNLSLWITF